MYAWFAVAAGASVGAWMRWGFSLWFAPNIIPYGTLLANSLGGFLMGIAMALVQAMPQLSPELRLLITTGFLGGLTTFSTFSAEAVGLLQKQAYAWATAHILLHLILSLGLTMLGYSLAMRFFQQA